MKNWMQGRMDRSRGELSKGDFEAFPDLPRHSPRDSAQNLKAAEVGSGVRTFPVFTIKLE